MADAQTKKLQEEVDILDIELKAVEKAISTKEACKGIFEFCGKTPDPFLGDNETPNIWLSSSKAGGGCDLM